MTQQKKCPSAQIHRKIDLFIPRDGITADYQSFIFLSELNNIVETGWDNSSISKLWRYNLHYFEYLLQNNSDESYLASQTQIIDNYLSDTKH
mgnify:CR=1 FL=1